MLRALYPVLFCVAVALLATMLFCPSAAQQAVDFVLGVTNLRAQSPDPVLNSSGAYTPAIPNDMYFQGPARPTPVSRPVSWPGTPVDSYGQSNAPAQSTTVSAPANNGAAGSPSPRVGVTVWDPSPGQACAAPGATASQQQYLPAQSPAPQQQYSQAQYPQLQYSQSPYPQTQYSAANATPYPQTQYPQTSYPQTKYPAATLPTANVAPSSGVMNPVANPISAPMTVTPGVASVPSATAAIPPSGISVASALPPAAQFPVPAAQLGPMGSSQLGALSYQQNTNLASPQTAELGAANMQILPSPPKEYPDAQVAARIGTEVVLVGDLKALAGDTIVQRKLQIPKEQEEEVYKVLSRQVLKQVIETKLVYNEAMHTIPQAGLTSMETKVNEYFDQEKIAEMMKSYNVNTRQELDTKLREHGSTIDRSRRQFFERTVAQEWLRQQVKLDEEVPAADILGYYQQHLADYEYPAKSRWEELMVQFDQFPSKQAAYAAIAQMGNQAMQGTAFAEVAKKQSQGPTAANGGAYDWTTKGALASKTIDDAIFALPVGRFSHILEDERGFHIVRVLERKDAGRKSFVDAQGDIKKQLKEDRTKKQITDYIDGLRKKTPVTTMYDNQPGGLDGPQKDAG